MIKGNERRIIVIEKAEDPYFERAVFYVRRGVKEGNGKSMTRRAQEIFEEICALKEEKEPAKKPSAEEKNKGGIIRRLLGK